MAVRWKRGLAEVFAGVWTWFVGFRLVEDMGLACWSNAGSSVVFSFVLFSVDSVDCKWSRLRSNSHNFLNFYNENLLRSTT